MSTEQQTVPPIATRIPPHLQLAIGERIARVVDDAIEYAAREVVRPAGKTAMTKVAADDIVRKVAEYIDSREVSMISGLSSAAYHIGKVRESITQRRNGV